MDFFPNFLEVGNFSALGAWEDDMENRVREMVDDLKSQYGLCVPSYIITEELRQRGIPYEQLPQYIIDIIDGLDCY